MPQTDGAPGYAAPALEKGLDVLELLADSSGPRTQTEIAVALGRSVGQLFRVLLTLERRGFLVRTGSGGYLLSPRLFDLAHRQPPLRGLLAAAAPPMRRLADQLGQSCNLGVREGDSVRVVAQEESPTAFGFSVRVGALFPVGESLTGAVLRAFGPGGSSDVGAADLRRAGHGEREDGLHAGITDIAYPVFGPDPVAVAALTVPYVATSYSGVALPAVRTAVAEAAAAIGLALGEQRESTSSGDDPAR
ncbi:MAG: winged helix-turn-helix transcriptional regulator [Microbacteriaceae bacterium]|jgi:DNA-binding IclR family transcriptional regulator|nr:winged helix-turn-helix transcriptional regulator [Microbacteriaceae bacterium]